MDLKNLTNESVFKFLRESDIKFENHSLAAERLGQVLEIDNDETTKLLQEKIRKFCGKLNKKWQQCRRTNSRFVKANQLWLSEPFNFLVVGKENPMPPKSKSAPSSTQFRRPFERLCLRQKKRNTEYLKQYPEEHLNFAAKKNIKSVDARFIHDFIEAHPEHAQKVRKFCENLISPSEEGVISKEQALSVSVAADLTKNQYNVIRKYAKNFPSYYQLQKAKLDCYPVNNSLTFSESSAKVVLQELLDKTSERLVQSLSVKLKSDRKYILISKWGCDGAADQSEYNIAFSTDSSDKSIFICSLVPIKLFDTTDNSILWQNEFPSSTRYCRPIQFHFIKETEATVKLITGEIETEIHNLIPSQFNNVTVQHELLLTMVDGKIINIMTDTKSSMRCFLCGACPKDMNNLSLVNQRTINKNNLSFGISSLHAWICFFECLLHISYNLPFKSWSAKSEEQKTLKNKRKTEIQNEFRRRTGLLVDVVQQGRGNTNTGNTARKFFNNPALSAEITGLDEELIERFSVILRSIVCGEKINVINFRDYCYATALHYVNLYSWYFMPVSVHKILIHGADIIEHAVLPIGQLGEDAQEANHKLLRSYRENHSRKISRVANNEDVFKYLLLASDPIVTKLRPKINTKNQNLPSSVLNLLM